MLKVGLTGGIGSGKTTVAKILELLNVPVYYADEASKRLYHTDKDLIAAIKKNFVITKRNVYCLFFYRMSIRRDTRARHC